MNLWSKFRFRKTQREKITRERIRRKDNLDQYLKEAHVGDDLTHYTLRLLKEYSALLDYLIRNPEL